MRKKSLFEISYVLLSRTSRTSRTSDFATAKQYSFFGIPSNIFSQHQCFFFSLKVVGYKKPLFEVFVHKDFLFKISFKQMVLKYGVCFIELQARHFGATTVKWWALKNHCTR